MAQLSHRAVPAAGLTVVPGSALLVGAQALAWQMVRQNLAPIRQKASVLEDGLQLAHVAREVVALEDPVGPGMDAQVLADRFQALEQARGEEPDVRGPLAQSTGCPVAVSFDEGGRGSTNLAEILVKGSVVMVGDGRGARGGRTEERQDRQGDRRSRRYLNCICQVLG